MKKHSKEDKGGGVFSWIFGILFVIGGLVNLIKGFVLPEEGVLILQSLLVLIGGVVILPPGTKYITNKYNVRFGFGGKIVFMIGIIILATILGMILG